MRSPAKPGDPASGSATRLPLPTLLSQALVAFTIEFDNEFERQMPHWTTAFGHGSTSASRQGPWLVSMVMWWNCMRFVGEDGVTVGELERLTRTHTNLNGMVRRGYIVVAPDPADSRPKPPHSDWVIRATAKGQQAQQVWQPLFAAIEKRWRARFGEDEIDQLRESLWALVKQTDVDLPDCLPILGYGFWSSLLERKRRAPATPERGSLSLLPLPASLSRVLLAFAVAFEQESELSLAISANVLRVLDGNGVRVRDLPLLSGVSKEAISMAMSILQKTGLATVETEPIGSRARVAYLTPLGRKTQDAYLRLLSNIEERSRNRFGEEAIGSLRESLERLVGDGTAQGSFLFRGLEPYPDGWRASVRKPNTLPHYPTALHRGGFPDGS